MRVPGIGSFSPVDAVSWVRATSPSELVYRQRTKRPMETPSQQPPAVASSTASAANDARAHVQEAALGLRRVGQSLRAAVPAAGDPKAAPNSTTAAPPAPSADDTIADAYPGVRGGTITVNGHSISVTPGVTTLREVVAALDTIPGLFAAVDSATGTIMVAGLMADKKLEITDSTGLLHALGLQTGVIVPPNSIESEGAKSTAFDPNESAARVGRVFERVNDAMHRLANGPRELDALRVAASSSVTKAIGSLEGLAAQAFRVDSQQGAMRVSVDVGRLAGVLRKDPKALGNMLEDGLAEPLEHALEQTDDDANAPRSTGAIPPKGTLLTPRPPVELFEAVLAHAALGKP
jgi:hypothetical protein